MSAARIIDVEHFGLFGAHVFGRVVEVIVLELGGGSEASRWQVSFYVGHRRFLGGQR